MTLVVVNWKNCCMDQLIIEFESIDLSDEVSKGKLIKQAIRNGIASHVQTVGKGGLLVTLAKN